MKIVFKVETSSYCLCKLFELSEGLFKESPNPFFTLAKTSAIDLILFLWMKTLFKNEKCFYWNHLSNNKPLACFLSGGDDAKQMTFIRGQISPILRALDLVFKCCSGSIAMRFPLLRTSEIPAHQNVFIQPSLPIQLQFRPLLHRRRTSLKSRRTREQREGFCLFVYNSLLWDPPGVKKRIVHSLVRSEQQKYLQHGTQ